jgi:hypothetical protein
MMLMLMPLPQGKRRMGFGGQGSCLFRRWAPHLLWSSSISAIIRIATLEDPSRESSLAPRWMILLMALITEVRAQKFVKNCHNCFTI